MPAVPGDRVGLDQHRQAAFLLFRPGVAALRADGLVVAAHRAALEHDALGVEEIGDAHRVLQAGGGFLVSGLP